MTPPPGANQQLLRLTGLLQLEQKLRRAGPEELGFLLVNETLTVLPYQQSALWITQPEGGGRLQALSGVPEVDQNAPYPAWVRQVLAHLSRDAQAETIRAITPELLPRDLAASWGEWWPTYVLWLPLLRREGGLVGGLLLTRADDWTQGDVTLLSLVAENFVQSWILTHLPKGLAPVWTTLKRRRTPILAAVVVVLGLAFWPVRQSVLAPAEIVPITPLLVRAPFDGVIDAMHVTPNALVHEGQTLLSFDTRQLRTRLTVASKAKAMAEAELQQAAQQSFSDPKIKGRVAILRSKVEQQDAELEFIRGQLNRAEVTAPGNGVAVYDDPAEWIGRPVSTGERIMMVAAPDQSELEIHVPVADAVTFDTGSDVVFFPNIAPEHPLAAQLTFASYGSAMAADGVLAYRYRANFPDMPRLEGQPPRLGLKGIAKIYGQRRPLLLWLLRRPLGVVRQWLTL